MAAQVIDGLWPVLTGIDDAAFLVAWERGRIVRAQRYDARSRPLGSRFMLYDGTPEREWPRIAALASHLNGGFVLLLTVVDAEGSTYSLRGVVYTPRLELLQESDVAMLAEQPASPGVAVAPDSSFMVVWIANSANEEPLVYARPYDAEAVPRADALVVNDQQPMDRVAAVASGPHGFTVLWRAAHNPGFARRFDLFGSALGWPFEVGIWDAACSDAAGNLMLVWSAYRKGGHSRQPAVATTTKPLLLGRNVAAHDGYSPSGASPTLAKVSRITAALA